MHEKAPLSDEQLLASLEPTAEALMERHLTKAKEWFPHEIVPWGLGRDFVPNEEWDESYSRLNLLPEVRDSLRLNLLTEDNLPHYFQLLSRTYGQDGIWGMWSRRWTAEEGRHSIVIRDYLTVNNAVDLRQLERDRMSQVEKGEVPSPGGIADGIVYVALQELATRISHMNTGKLLSDSAGEKIMNRVAADENLHHLFYRDLVSSALEIDPSQMVEAIWRQIRKFDMPGTGIDNYGELKKKIALVGIFGATELADKVIEPVVDKQWKIWDIEGLTPSAEKARIRLEKRVQLLGNYALQEQEVREEFQSKVASNSN